MATNLDPDIIPREPFRSPAPYLCEFRLFGLMTLWAVRSDICKAWNDHDVRPEVLRHGNIALGVRHKILSLAPRMASVGVADRYAEAVSMPDPKPGRLRSRRGRSNLRR